MTKWAARRYSNSDEPLQSSPASESAGSDGINQPQTDYLNHTMAASTPTSRCGFRLLHADHSQTSQKLTDITKAYQDPRLPDRARHCRGNRQERLVTKNTMHIGIEKKSCFSTRSRLRTKTVKSRAAES